MKRLFATLLSFVLLGQCFADDGVNKLRIQISGPENNHYFLCLNNTGCVSIYAGNKGMVFPLDETQVDNLIVADIVNKKMYIQPVPKSCSDSLKDGQTLTISGNLALAHNQAIYIKHLNCAIK